MSEAVTENQSTIHQIHPAEGKEPEMFPFELSSCLCDLHSTFSLLKFTSEQMSHIVLGRFFSEAVDPCWSGLTSIMEEEPYTDTHSTHSTQVLRTYSGVSKPTC